LVRLRQCGIALRRLGEILDRALVVLFIHPDRAAVVIHLGEIAWRELARPHGALALRESFVGIKRFGLGIFVTILSVFVPLRKSGSAEGKQEQNWREPSKHGKGLHRRV